MHIVWFSWKDREHPLAGGAEAVSGSIMDQLVAKGHSVTLFTARYPGSAPQETKNGINIIRQGNRYSVYFACKKAYKNNQLPADVVIDEMNTIPFFAARYTKAPKKVLLAYQLAREVWFYQMVFPFSLVGYITEPILLRWLAPLYPKVLTESKSTKEEMARFGFKNISVFRVGMDIHPLDKLPPKPEPTLVLSLGAIRPMKRTLHAVKAFEFARDVNPALSMIIAGDDSGSYGAKVHRYVQTSRHKSAVQIVGRVTKDEKLRLMKEAGVILVTSIKEGWGLIVTEANSQGTPAIAYNTDGLRDSIRTDETGLLAEQGNPADMGRKIVELLSNQEQYTKMRKEGWRWSKEFTFTNSYADFSKEIGLN